VAGQIYRALAYRFGKRNGKAPYQITPDILAPRPKIDPTTLADTESQEDSNTADLNTAGEDANQASPSTNRVKPVLMPVETRPTSVTTLPAKKPITAPGKNPQQTPPSDARPRRVLTNTP
jgi:hypothetical protein